MKRYLFTSVILAIFAVCFSSEATAQKLSRAVTDTTRWAPITVAAPSECTGEAKDCAVKMLGGLNIDVGSKPDFSVYQLGQTEGKAVTVVFVSHLPEEDDSIIGVLYRLEMSQMNAKGGSFTLEALGRMYQCLNGPDGWQKTACR